MSTCVDVRRPAVGVRSSVPVAVGVMVYVGVSCVGVG